MEESIQVSIISIHVIDDAAAAPAVVVVAAAAAAAAAAVAADSRVMQAACFLHCLCQLPQRFKPASQLRPHC